MVTSWASVYARMSRFGDGRFSAARGAMRRLIVTQRQALGRPAPPRKQGVVPGPDVRSSRGCLAAPGSGYAGPGQGRGGRVEAYPTYRRWDTGLSGRGTLRQLITISATRSRIAARLVVFLAAAVLAASNGAPAAVATKVSGSGLSLLARLTTAPRRHRLRELPVRPAICDGVPRRLRWAGSGPWLPGSTSWEERQLVSDCAAT